MQSRHPNNRMGQLILWRAVRKVLHRSQGIRRIEPARSISLMVDDWFRRVTAEELQTLTIWMVSLLLSLKPPGREGEANPAEARRGPSVTISALSSVLECSSRAYAITEELKNTWQRASAMGAIEEGLGTVGHDDRHSPPLLPLVSRSTDTHS